MLGFNPEKPSGECQLINHRRDHKLSREDWSTHLQKLFFERTAEIARISRNYRNEAETHGEESELRTDLCKEAARYEEAAKTLCERGDKLRTEFLQTVDNIELAKSAERLDELTAALSAREREFRIEAALLARTAIRILFEQTLSKHWWLGVVPKYVSQWSIVRSWPSHIRYMIACNNPTLRSTMKITLKMSWRQFASQWRFVRELAFYKNLNCFLIDVELRPRASTVVRNYVAFQWRKLSGWSKRNFLIIVIGFVLFGIVTGKVTELFELFISPWIAIAVGFSLFLLGTYIVGPLLKRRLLGISKHHRREDARSVYMGAIYSALQVPVHPYSRF